MSMKIGRLGHPRIAIALIWIIPADSSADVSRTSKPESIPPEDIEFVSTLTGLAPDQLVARLEEIVTMLHDDPAALRRELVRLADGDEVAAEEVIRLMRASGPGNDNGQAEEPNEERAAILDFERPTESGDDGGDEP